MNAASAPTHGIDLLADRAGRACNRHGKHEGASPEQHYSALMRAAQNGDRAAYSTLLYGLLPLLQRLVRGRLRFLQAADREDLVQEIMLSIHAGRASYDSSRPFMPWLMSIAHHRMVDGARRCGRKIAREQLVGHFAEPVADRPGREESEYRDPEALRRAVTELPRRQQTAIELLKLRELSLSEASALTGIGMSALKVSVHRAIKNLRSALDPALDQPALKR
jgi:RNA polymerase sigma factor (sigma-70 family)